MSKCVLIPAAKKVQENLAFEFGQISPPLLPLGGKPILKHIIQFYTEQEGDYHYHVITHSDSKDLLEYSETLKEQNININTHKIDEVRDLGFSIKKGLEEINPDDYNGIFIHYGDTLLDEKLPCYDCKKDYIFYSKRKESFRWTTFDQNADKIDKIHEKRILDGTGVTSIFIGLFFLKSIHNFNIHLRDALNKSSKLDSFYEALLKYLKEQKYYDLIETKNWLDLGHADNYYATKRKYINAREFNSLSVDGSRGTITKRSDHKKDLKNEIDWYLEIPENVQYYLPRIFSYSSGSDPFIELEHYGYPNLGEVFTYGNFTRGSWGKCIESIFTACEVLHGNKKPKIENEELIQSLKTMYIDKTLGRLESLKGNRHFQNWWNRPIEINGKKYKSLRFYQSKVSTLSKNILFPETPKFATIHGDLCLANILYDRKNNIPKFIDPRGKFGQFKVYGDKRYDYAKLLHSFHGKYEHIINDQFSLKYQENFIIEYNIINSDDSKEVYHLFLKYLENYIDFPLKEIFFIEALLYLGMVPLHNDYPTRQVVMLSRGIEFLDDILEGSFK